MKINLSEIQFKISIIYFCIILFNISISGCTKEKEKSKPTFEDLSTSIDKAFETQNLRDSLSYVYSQKYGAKLFPPDSFYEKGFFDSFKPPIYYQYYFKKLSNSRILFKGYIVDLEIIGEKTYVDLLCPLNSYFNRPGDEPTSILFRIDISQNLVDKIYSKIKNRNVTINYRWLFYPDYYAIVEVDSIRKINYLKYNSTVIGLDEVDLSVVNNRRFMGFGDIVDLIEYDIK